MKFISFLTSQEIFNFPLPLRFLFRSLTVASQLLGTCSGDFKGSKLLALAHAQSFLIVSSFLWETKTYLPESNDLLITPCLAQNILKDN